MPHYSVVAAKDNLADLINRALAGEEVVITRHGKPTVAMRAVEASPKPTRAEAFERLRKVRESLPVAKTSYLELKRLDEEERSL